MYAKVFYNINYLVERKHDMLNQTLTVLLE